MRISLFSRNPGFADWLECCFKAGMKKFLFCVLLIISLFSRAEVPKLLTERAFNSASLAEAANHFIAIGEPATFKELQAFLAEDSTSTNQRSRGYYVDERIAWIFRMIYVPKEPVPMRVPKTGAWIPGNIVPLRAPDFGWLQLPETVMPAEKWPLYPLALSGSTFIVLNEKYTRKNEAESLKHYMEYCKANGAFRTTPVTVPTREQALADTEQFHQSPLWKNIKWMGNGGLGFPWGERRTWAFIQNQARTIPEVSITAKKQPDTTVAQVSTR